MEYGGGDGKWESDWERERGCETVWGCGVHVTMCAHVRMQGRKDRVRYIYICRLQYIIKLGYGVLL